jgi:hypothetical protein
MTAGTVSVTPDLAAIGQEIFVSGSGWTASGRLVLTLIEGSTSAVLSNSVQLSSGGEMSWNGGVPGQFTQGSAVLTACYQGTTICRQAPLSLVQQTR